MLSPKLLWLIAIAVFAVAAPPPLLAVTTRFHRCEIDFILSLFRNRCQTLFLWDGCYLENMHIGLWRGRCAPLGRELLS